MSDWQDGYETGELNMRDRLASAQRKYNEDREFKARMIERVKKAEWQRDVLAQFLIEAADGYIMTQREGAAALISVNDIYGKLREAGLGDK